MTSKSQEPLVEVGDKAMDTPSAALNLDFMAPQPQVNLANVEDVAMNTPSAALNPENIASQPQDNLQRVADVSIDLPGKGKTISVLTVVQLEVSPLYLCCCLTEE